MNIKMQCCGILLMVVIFYFYYRQKKINLNTERAFLRIYTIVILSLTLDVLSIIVLQYSDSLPNWLVNTVCKAYVSSLVLVALNGVLYVFADVFSQSRQYYRRVVIYCSLVLAGIVLICCLPIYKHVENHYDTYTYGPSVMTTYVICMLLFTVLIYLVIRYRSKMNPKRRDAVKIWILLWIGSAVIQFFNNKLLLVGYAGAISVMVIYLKLENPETNLDRQTGLFNQNALMQYIKQSFTKEQDFALIILNLPHFLLHADTDDSNEAMMEIVKYLSTVPNAIAFRDSDDEMLLLLKNPSDVAAIEQQLQDRFDDSWGSRHETYIHPDWMIVPSAKIINQAEDLIHCLQYAKQNSIEFSENGRMVLDQDITNRMYEEQLIEQLLVDAIQNDWIEVYYQPIYSVQEKRFVSAEALSRIVQHHPEKLGIEYIEVNLSVVQCSYEHLADSFIEIMEWYRIDPAMINLEITESGSVAVKKTLLDNMNQLINYGVKFSLDDFGTGHSNLNYIVEMPVDIVKFDRSMIESYFDNGKAKYVMDAAMHMIHGMNLQIVSEGIETEEQLDTMEELGISYIQGYYFSRPIPSQDFLAFVEAHSSEPVNNGAE